MKMLFCVPVEGWRGIGGKKENRNTHLLGLGLWMILFLTSSSGKESLLSMDSDSTFSNIYFSNDGTKLII